MVNKKILLSLLLTLFVTACATPPPKNPDNICHIFFENRDWYEASKDMNKKWGTPIHVPIAMMYQESSFKHDAAPPMQYFWFIPIGRASDAYGYAQAKTMTWDDYKRETGIHGQAVMILPMPLILWAGLPVKRIKLMVFQSGMPIASILITMKAGEVIKSKVITRNLG